MKQTAWILMVALAVASCGDADDDAAAPVPAPAPTQATPPDPGPTESPTDVLPRDASLDEAIRLLAREALRQAAGPEAPADAIRIDDETPRMDTEREPPEGCVWLFLHSAGVHVSVQGLTGVAFELDGNGLDAVLSYGGDTLRIEDRGRSDSARKSLKDLRRAGEADWKAIWPGVEKTYRAWATAARALPEDIEGAWEDADTSHEAAVDGFSGGIETLEGLYRSSLRAPADRTPSSMGKVYVEHAYRLARRHLFAGADAPEGAALKPLASGPCEGARRGDPETGSGTVMLTGASGILVRIAVERTNGGSLQSAAVTETIRSFRPYAPGPEDMGLIGDAKSPAAQVLVAFSRMHLERTVANATSFLSAWSAMDGAPAEAERRSFARTLAAHHGWSEAAEEMERAASGR